MSVAGLAIAAIAFVGVVALINSKRLSWKMYERYFKPPKPDGVPLPEPHGNRPLQWGVRTWNTYLALLPDVLLPIVFIGAWLLLLL